jgi:putative effector of murein hydrolase
MSNRHIVRVVWCLLLGAALILSNLPATGWPYQTITEYASNHWFHFLLYAAIVAVPVTLWKRKYRFMLSLVAVLLVIALGSLQAFIPGHQNRSQNAMPDLFGVAAGVLLGLNLRMLHSPESPSAPPKQPYRSSRAI